MNKTLEKKQHQQKNTIKITKIGNQCINKTQKKQNTTKNTQYKIQKMKPMHK
jgi:hypothetical protein